MLWSSWNQALQVSKTFKNYYYLKENDHLVLKCSCTKGWLPWEYMYLLYVLLPLSHCYYDCSLASTLGPTSIVIWWSPFNFLHIFYESLSNIDNAGKLFLPGTNLKDHSRNILCFYSYDTILLTTIYQNVFHFMHHM